jgi:homoserine O-acetyltransferase
MFALLAALAAQVAPLAPPTGWGAAAPIAKTAWPAQERDVLLKAFRFRDGETLPELKMHLTTLGQPHRNASGEIDNAVMVLHGTGGTGQQFLRPQFADELYGPGQPLDIRLTACA